ncbi:glycosyltransferase family 4 protein [Candidatus Pacearchaeota archaeon]|nr:glycosyltransferase family 4 protein [Candidatus Pacearchaeota archaeon]
MKKEWDEFYYISPFSILSDFGTPSYLKKPYYFIYGNLWRVNKVIDYCVNSPNMFIGRSGIFLKNYHPKLYKKLKPSFPDKPPYFVDRNKKYIKRENFDKSIIEDEITQIDEWYNFKIDKIIKKLLKKNKYDIVIVEYVFMSRALLNFKDNTIKIIDTHDVFTDRNKKYEKKGVIETFFSTTFNEESKGLNRADKVIAIQKEEEIIFKNMVDRPIFTIGHCVELLKPSIKNNVKNRILFLGTANKANIHGVKYFIEEIFPLIKEKIPDTKLVLAGKISDSFKDFKDCIRLGEVDSLRNAYDFSDVVINPTLIGTGLKIKNIEALGYGKPLVMSLHSSEGIIGEDKKDFVIAKNNLEFSKSIIKILTDVNYMNELSNNAYKLAKKYNYNNINIIKELMD